MVETMFKIEIEKEVDDKINWFSNNYEQEISGWLVGEFTKDLITITDLLIPHQEVGGVSVDTTGGDLIKLRKEYGDKCLKIVGHYHSHNTMSNNWSGTDEEFIEQFMEQRQKAIFLVSSKSDGHRLRLELRTPLSISIDDLEYSVVCDGEDLLGDELRKVIEEKVTVAKSTTYNNYNNHNNNYNRNIYEEWDNGNYGSENFEDTKKDTINEEVNKMITFHKKNNVVDIMNLTYQQYGNLEELGEHDNKVVENKWHMRFRPKNKKKAIGIMREAKSYLIDEIRARHEINNISEDLGY